MFIEQHSDTLRQGDILEKVFFISPSFHQLKDGQILLPQTPALRQAYLVVLSHCCDLQWLPDERGYLRPRRRYTLVAPLSLGAPFEKETEEYRKLIENGENQPDNDPIQYFHFQHNPIIGGESFVDFSTIMPIKSSTLRDLGARKLLELDIKSRHLLRVRLQEYFSRIPDEEWDEVNRLFPKGI